MKLRVKPTILRAAILLILIAVQLALMAATIWTTSQASALLNGVLSLVSLLVVLYIVRSNADPSYKLTWSVLILIVPVFGGLFYLFFGLQPSSRKLRRRIAGLDISARPYRRQEGGVVEAIGAMRDDFGRQAAYLSRTAG
ncbi:MAG TPA: PLD nuclease N-terminal domain-containing protein, partial [Spirochaetales bacterium]|nr:PLD nuclease N-terminal domain-containing protein [Spirochaetales bacterium]